MAIIVSVISVKGGVGKTATAVHLAAYFQQYGPTLLVDGDATRSATFWASKGKLSFKVVPERGLAREMSESRYDFVIIDTEANPTDDDMKELAEAARLVVIPATPDALGLQAALQTSTKLGRLAPATPYRILLTIVPPKPNRDGDEAKQFLDEGNLPRFSGSIRRLVAFSRAVLDGVTVEVADRNNLGWQDYVGVGDEIRQMLSMRVSA